MRNIFIDELATKRLYKYLDRVKNLDIYSRY